MAVLHAHDYPPVEFMRRYFDEYRGLRETIGHVEPFAPRSALHDVRALVAHDRRYMREQELSGAQVARWTARSAVHHAGRKAFSALGSRADALPPRVQRRLSLERRANGVPPGRPAARADAGRAPVRDDRPRPARRTGPAARAVRRDGRPRAAARRVRDPDLQHRLRRPQHHRPDRAAARAHGPQLLAVGARRVQPPPVRRAGGAAARDRRALRAAAGAGVPRVRRLVRRRRRRRHRLADRLPGAAAGGRARPRLPDQRPRAGVLRRRRSSPSGRS